MRKIFTLLFFIFCIFLAWLSGYDFDRRNMEVSLYLTAVVFFTVIFYFFPGWDDYEEKRKK